MKRFSPPPGAERFTVHGWLRAPARGILVCVPAAPDLTGRALDDRYELHAVIGEGAFGRVYRGLDRRLARTVAVKVIKPWWAEDTAWVERFEREAQLLARVSDPGIVQIYDIGHAKEGPYYVAEFVEGESLAERLLAGPLPVEEAREIAEQLCDALASAHAQGVVHCDVKPANVLLASDGSLKVGDFGVARLAGGTSQALSTTVAGTPRYMSPEQARGRPTSAATDVYSAGVVLYEMLTGEPPFMDGSAVALGLRHLQDLPAPLPEDVPDDLAAVVDRALAKDPAERWRDGAQMASAIRACREQPIGRGARAAHPADTGGPQNGGGTATIVLEQPATVRLSSADRLDVASAAAETRILAGRARPAQAPQISRTRRRRRLILPAALVVGFAAALTIFVFASAGASTTVPDVHGLPRGGVEARAKRLDVHPSFASRYSMAAAGTAISQNPSPGSHVTAGSTVSVVLSAGPPPVTVPAVVGQSAQSAQLDDPRRRASLPDRTGSGARQLPGDRRRPDTRRLAEQPPRLDGRAACRRDAEMAGADLLLRCRQRTVGRVSHTRPPLACDLRHVLPGNVRAPGHLPGPECRGPEHGERLHVRQLRTR